MTPIIQMEQDLEKRSVNGAYIYFGAWVMIGIATDYHQGQPLLFWSIASILGVLGVTRLLAYKYSKKMMAFSHSLWHNLLVLNALGPALVFGFLFALTMAESEHSTLFIYLLMANLALISGGAVTYSPNRVLANYFLIVITVPALVTALVLPQERGVEAIMLAIYMVFTFFQVKLLNREYLERVEQRLQLERLARIDSLTGIYNRRFFDESLLLYWNSHLRSQSAIGLVLIDIDDFKAVNDSYGHPVGDQVIKSVAEIIKSSFKREADIVARIGGEEYAAIISEPNLGFIEKITKTICSRVSNAPIQTEEGKIDLTISIGAVHIIPNVKYTHGNFYKHADNCLYQAKEQGKNRSVIEAIL